MGRKRARVEEADESVASAVFERVFEFDIDSGWSLPACDRLFVGEAWECEQLCQLDHQLNSVKVRLSDKPREAWGRHTNDTNLAGAILPRLARLRPELLTQAWCKFYELLAVHRALDDLPSDCRLASLHLCEAPGAFVAALNHYCRSGGLSPPDWHATTLNPHHELSVPGEVIADDRLMVSEECRRRWLFGPDDRGDLRSRVTGQHAVSSISRPCDLVTADGSVDCSDRPDQQESRVLDLLYCEVVCALSALSPPGESVPSQKDGGVLVLKMFTFFLSRTVCLLFLMATSFRRVRVVKPSCSKAGNSEVYVICSRRRSDLPSSSASSLLWQHYGDYKSSQSAFISRCDIPEVFMRQVIECARFFANLQIEEIQRNIGLFECALSDVDEFHRQMKLVEARRQQVAERYMRLCRVERVHFSNFIAPPFSVSERCWWTSRCKSAVLLGAGANLRKVRAALDGLSDVLHRSSGSAGLVVTACKRSASLLRPQNMTVACCPASDLHAVCHHSLFCHPTLLAAFSAALSHVTADRSVESADGAVRACLTAAAAGEGVCCAAAVSLEHLTPRLLTPADVTRVLEAWQRCSADRDSSDLCAGVLSSHGHGVGGEIGDIDGGDGHGDGEGGHDDGEDGRSLLISGFSLLHRLNVSVLLVLSGLCQRVVLLPPEASPLPIHELWRVRLEGISCSTHVQKVLGDLVRILEHPACHARSEHLFEHVPTGNASWTVLSLLPVTTLLRDSEFFTLLNKYNNSCLAPLARALLTSAEQLQTKDNAL